MTEPETPTTPPATDIPAPDEGTARPPADNADTLQEFADTYRASGGGAGGTDPADGEEPAPAE